MGPKKFLQRPRWDGFKNTSGDTCPPFGILAVTGMEMRGDVFKRPVLTCDKPGTTFYREYAVNGPTQVKAGKYGKCTQGPGLIWVKYDTGTPANGEGWGPKPGQFTASKGFPGLTIKGIVKSADKIALATLDTPLVQVLGKTTGAITGGSASTSYRIYAGGTLGSEADAGWTTVPSALSLEDIDSGLWITLTWLANGWRMEPLECNA